MALGDLFKSEKERKREKEKKRRMGLRKVERCVEDVSMEVKNLKRERDSAWQDAKRQLEDGQKVAAKRAMTTVRATEIQMAKLENKAWFYSQVVRKIRLSEIDQRFQVELTGLTSNLQIDPVLMEEALDGIVDKLDEQTDVDRVVNDAYQRELGQAERAIEDTVPSLDQMMVDLEDDVSFNKETSAADNIGKVSRKTSEGAEDTASLRKRVRNLIERSES